VGVSGSEYQLLGVHVSGSRNRWWVCLGGQCRVMFVSWETTVSGCVWEETNSVHLVYVCLEETGLLQLVSHRVPALVYVCLGGDWFTAVGFPQGPSIGVCVSGRRLVYCNWFPAGSQH